MTAYFLFTVLVLLVPLAYSASPTIVKSQQLAPPDNWSMDLHDPQHTAYSQSTIPLTNSTAWIQAISGSAAFGLRSPVIVDGLVIVASNNGRIYEFNSTTGERIWMYDLGTGVNSITSSPAVSSGRIFIGSVDHRMYCLNQSSGNILWTFITSGGIWASPIIVDDQLFFSSDDTKLYCVNASTGVQLWNQFTWGSYTSPAFWNGIVLSGSEPFFALNATNGAVVWSVNDLSVYIQSSLVVGDGRLFFTDGVGNVFCFNASHGQQIWNTSVAGQTFSGAPITADGRLFIGADNGYAYCLNAFSGSMLWRYQTAGAIQGSAAIADGKVVFASLDHNIYALTEDNGTLLWKYQTAQYVRSPTVYDGKVFAASYSGDAAPYQAYVYAFGPNQTLATTLALSLNPSTSFAGFRVNLTGALKSNGTGVVGVTVFFSYSVTGGQTWNDIISTKTGADGNYSALWLPTSVGLYIVKASWAGNETYGASELTRMFSSTSFDNQYIFSASSNSSISELAFNVTGNQLGFTVTGQAGTTGFADVAIPKNLVANIAELKVYLDGASINYVATSTTDSWLLHFTYTHSTHNVIVNLGTTIIPEFPSWIMLLTLVLISLFVIAVKKKNRVSHDSARFSVLDLHE